MGRSGKSGRRVLQAIIAALLALLVIDVAGAPAQAAVTRSDFLKKAVVKEKMDGSGRWYRYIDSSYTPPLGSEPAGCSSDRPISRARHTKVGHYWGPVAAPATYYGTVNVTVSEFGNKRAAKRAIRKLDRWVSDCPTTVEWYCEDCDGIAEIHRSAAKPRKVGVQSFTWNERTISMGLGNARMIAARRGRTVVIVDAGHQEDPITTTTPVAPSWRTTVALARRSLARATS